MISIVVVDDHAVVRSGLRLLLEAEKDMKVVGDAGNAATRSSRCAPASRT